MEHPGSNRITYQENSRQKKLVAQKENQEGSSKINMTHARNIKRGDPPNQIRPCCCQIDPVSGSPVMNQKCDFFVLGMNLNCLGQKSGYFREAVAPVSFVFFLAKVRDRHSDASVALFCQGSHLVVPEPYIVGESVHQKDFVFFQTFSFCNLHLHFYGLVGPFPTDFKRQSHKKQNGNHWCQNHPKINKILESSKYFYRHIKL